MQSMVINSKMIFVIVLRPSRIGFYPPFLASHHRRQGYGVVDRAGPAVTFRFDMGLNQSADVGLARPLAEGTRGKVVPASER